MDSARATDVSFLCVTTLLQKMLMHVSPLRKAVLQRANGLSLAQLSAHAKLHEVSIKCMQDTKNLSSFEL